jgi:two-component system cell cycle response regulator
VDAVIVVDDEPANVRLLTRQLARDGHVVLAATNGEEALDLIAREQPDLVLMDVVMPRRTAMKRAARSRKTPRHD